ncbi:hypothetical protein GCM10027174_45000 [Salinifilum aidingensis]
MPTPDEVAREFIDQQHSRASITDGEKVMLNPGQVLDNVTAAMERLDADIDTPVSIEEDVIPARELMLMVDSFHLGSALMERVVNTAMRIYQARYPAELTERPLPPEYDLREIHPLQVTDEQHETAKTIFNRRVENGADLTPDDLAEYLESLSSEDEMQIFITLFYMYGTKLGAMKHRTGIE